MNVRKRTIVKIAIIAILAAGGFYFDHQMKKSGPAAQKILVATEQNHDAIFNRAVVFVIQQNGYDTAGLLLNGPPTAQRDVTTGGPDEQSIYYTLHSLDLTGKQTVAINGSNIGYTKGEAFFLLTQKMGDLPKKHASYRGYTHWKHGQLSLEILNGNWKVVDFNPNLVFRTNAAQMWAAANALPAVQYEDPQAR